MLWTFELWLSASDKKSKVGSLVGKSFGFFQVPKEQILINVKSTSKKIQDDMQIWWKTIAVWSDGSINFSQYLATHNKENLSISINDLAK